MARRTLSAVAKVLEEQDIVGEVGDAMVGEAVDGEQVGEFGGHKDADAGAGEALRE